MKKNKEKKYPTTEIMRTVDLKITNLKGLLDKLLRPQPFWAKQQGESMNIAELLRMA